MQIQKDLIHIERQSECLSLLSQDDCLSPQDHSQGDSSTAVCLYT